MILAICQICDFWAPSNFMRHVTNPFFLVLFKLIAICYLLLFATGIIMSKIFFFAFINHVFPKLDGSNQALRTKCQFLLILKSYLYFEFLPRQDILHIQFLKCIKYSCTSASIMEMLGTLRVRSTFFILFWLKLNHLLVIFGSSWWSLSAVISMIARFIDCLSLISHNWDAEFEAKISLKILSFRKFTRINICFHHYVTTRNSIICLLTKTLVAPLDRGKSQRKSVF